MGLLEVMTDRCKRDGICIETCPVGIIEFKDSGAYPTLVEGGGEFCLRCGHCVAVCPHAAMTHAEMRADQCPPVRKDWGLSPEQAEHFLRMRRSIRVYKKKNVERRRLSQLIDVARHAPSGHNSQPAEWMVIYDSRKVFELAGLVIDWMRHLVREGSPLAETMHLDLLIHRWESGSERIFRGAPHVILAHAHKDNRTAQAGCTIALAYLELMAPALGLGTCWAGYFTSAALFWPPVLEALSLPEGHLVFGAVMVGHPQFQYHRLPLRKAPRIDWR